MLIMQILNTNPFFELTVHKAAIAQNTVHNIMTKKEGQQATANEKRKTHARQGKLVYEKKQLSKVENNHLGFGTALCAQYNTISPH